MVFQKVKRFNIFVLSLSRSHYQKRRGKRKIDVAYYRFFYLPLSKRYLARFSPIQSLIKHSILYERYKISHNRLFEYQPFAVKNDSVVG